MVNEFNSQNDYRDKVVQIVDFLKKYSSKNSASMLLNFGDSNYNAIFARENFSKTLWVQFLLLMVVGTILMLKIFTDLEQLMEQILCHLNIGVIITDWIENLM